LIAWTIGGTAIAFFIAGVWAVRLSEKQHLWTWFPALLLLLGGGLGFVEGSIPGVLLFTQLHLP